MEGLRVLIQGVGHVGYQLAKLLTQNGAKVYISDINQHSLAKCRAVLQCQVIRPEDIYSAEYDIFAPCALGGIINNKTIDLLRCSIVAGSANNQLLESYHADLLHYKGILYSPDYIINSGGFVKVVNNTESIVLEKIDHIYEILIDLFKQSKLLNISPARVADRMAEQILYSNTHSEAV